jgi:hypothetical protein
VKGVLPATDALASSSRGTRVVRTRTEKLCQSAEIAFHVERPTNGRWSRDERQGGHPATLDAVAAADAAAAAAAPSNFPIGATPIYLRRYLMARSTTRILSLRPDEIIGTFVTPVTTDSLPTLRPNAPPNRTEYRRLTVRRGLRRVETHFDQHLAFVFILRRILWNLSDREESRPARRFHEFPKFESPSRRRDRGRRGATRFRKVGRNWRNGGEKNRTTTPNEATVFLGRGRSLPRTR